VATVVSSGKPLKIVVDADDALRMVSVSGEYPLREPRPIAHNVFEIDIPKTVSPGKYQLAAIGVTAIGVTSEPVCSPPVLIQVERDDLPVALKVQTPVESLISAGFPMPILVAASFADGSTLDVTHSIKTTFESRNRAIVIVDDQRRLVALGRGETTLLIGYAGRFFSTVVVDGPGTGFGGKWVASYNGAEQSADPAAIHEFEQSSFATHPSFNIDAVAGEVMPGKQIRIVGSGFAREQGRGFVTVAGIKGDIVAWTRKEITLVVPEFSTPGMITISLHQDDVSEDFPVRVPFEMFVHRPG
jgi:hypothetical protein